MAVDEPVFLTGRSIGDSMPLTKIFFHMFENSNEGCCIRNHHQKFIYANRAFLRHLGLNINRNIYGANLGSFATTLDIYRNKILSIESDAINNNSIKTFQYPFFTTNKRIIKSLSIEPFSDLMGNPIGTFWRISKFKMVGFKFSYITNFSIDPALKKLNGPLNLYSVNEWRILWPLFMGWREKGIADAFSVSRDHVRRVIKNGFEKLGVDSFEDFHFVVITLSWDEEVPEKMPYMPFSHN
jgi:PAS domain-containing protein